MTIQPFMFLILFVFVFGGAIAGSSQEYLQFALPGILVQSLAFTPFTTALGLNADFQRGLIDRFRSLPIARSAVISGRIVADGARIVWSILIITGFGVVLGFRFGGGVEGAIGAFLLLTAFGVTMCWPMAFIGITARTPESVNTWGFMIILPLTFASSAFAPVDTMPGWLQPFVKANPVTHVIDAARGMMLGGPVAEPLIDSVLWLIVDHRGLRTAGDRPLPPPGLSPTSTAPVSTRIQLSVFSDGHRQNRPWTSNSTRSVEKDS